MGKIFIGSSYPKKFKIGAFLIAKWSNVDYSHVYVRFESDNMPGTVYHAAHGMVHFRSTDNFLKENNIVEEFEIPDSELIRKPFLINCINIAGEKYGYLELVKIVLNDLANYFNCELINFDSRGYICSELVGKLMVEHLNFSFNKPLNLLKPIDIIKALELKYGKNV